MSARTFPAVLAAFLLIAGLVSVDAQAAQRGNAQGKAKNGPSFCRSGAGHPVFGRQWCLERGFSLGDTTWRRTDLGNVVFKRSPHGRVDATRLGAREIAEILTDVVLDEIFGESQLDLDKAKLGGMWRGGSDDGVFVLEILLGDAPVAELTDTNLDGRVDIVLIAGS